MCNQRTRSQPGTRQPPSRCSMIVRSRVDRAFPATHRHRLPMANQEVAHRRVAGQVVADALGQHRAQVQPRRHLACGIEMQDHLCAFARRPHRRGARIERVEPRVGEAQQPVGP